MAVNKSDPRTIVVVGGVAGGASAATRARRMNEQAEIILLEKDRDVSFANCGLPYHIGGEIADRSALVVASAEFLRRRFRLDVRTQHEVIAIDRSEKKVEVRRADTGESLSIPYDKLILAPGASPLHPPIPGADASNVLTLRNLDDMDRIKAIVDADSTRRTVVVGAGYVGLEMVEQLVERSIEVSLVELQRQVLPLLDPEMAEPIAAEASGKGVQLFLGRGVSEIVTDENARAVAVILGDGTRIDTDLVVLGIGVRPNVKLAVDAGLELGETGGILTNEFMQTSDPEIYAVGDACEYVYGPTGKRMRIALAGPANRAGRLAGQHAATDHSDPMPPVQGTSVVRVFECSAASTGMTRGFAKRFGIAANSVTIIAKHHAGYFPGAEMMTLKLVYDPETEKILGAQAVGGEGVDKRIDVIATAMQFGGTVRQLAGVDLCYAPPFGSAKDPVHMAAFAACNQLDQITEFDEFDADLTGKQVVDVRTLGEVEKSPLVEVSSVIHIPVDELRDRILELDSAIETVVTCAVGVRGHIAARILKQSGFNVSNLSGGATIRNRAMKE
ncbi:FAD-dependent oxidoreductase [Novipirellula artificiosorum]|uniref:Coenzyme A disulfide reductase n=1 Tax=Novipirellula artificiosorum TaxID=2528016 RepID=A0A5C6DJB1_9BACT|nr:FAD-dependent oxidoreductase [Novipirellula artificiosorum]TWU35987.1 Coenzyme A disulfide reductase [Novipirellula artificiosorum]